jgi:hypothetical protein
MPHAGMCFISLCSSPLHRSFTWHNMADMICRKVYELLMSILSYFETFFIFVILLNYTAKCICVISLSPNIYSAPETKSSGIQFHPGGGEYCPGIFSRGSGI